MRREGQTGEWKICPNGIVTTHRWRPNVAVRLRLQPPESRLRLAGAQGLGGLDHFPKLGILLQGLVLLHFQAGTEEEILERVAAENAMHDEAKFVPFKIHPVIAHPKPKQRA